jgi:hypothetical protein
MNFSEPFEELKQENLAGHHTEECDACGRVWCLTTPRWIYPHAQAPTSRGFFMDVVPEGEAYLIPYQHKAEWLAWKDKNITDIPEYCTLVKDITSIVFDEYKIDD